MYSQLVVYKFVKTKVLNKNYYIRTYEYNKTSRPTIFNLVLNTSTFSLKLTSVNFIEQQQHKYEEMLFYIVAVMFILIQKKKYSYIYFLNFKSILLHI